MAGAGGRGRRGGRGRVVVAVGVGVGHRVTQPKRRGSGSALLHRLDECVAELAVAVPDLV